MNVLHIDDQPGWRGGEQQAHYLIRGLTKRGYNIYLAGRRDGAFLNTDHGVEVCGQVPTWFRGEWDVWSAWVLARAVKTHDIHILHAHTSHAHTYACLARAFAGRGKVVVSRRVDFIPRNNLVSRLKYKGPDHYIAISERVGRVLREFGIPDSRFTVVHSGIDPTRFDVEPLPRSAIGAPEDAPVLANVAALVDHKDHATLLSAMPIVLRRLPELKLVIAGEGPLRGALEKQIRELGIESSVRLLGYRKDVPRLLRAVDAFVISSKEEGLGTSVLDAMVCGLPVIATAGGGIPEIVAHEKTGLLVPIQVPEALAEAILRVFTDDGLASVIRENGRCLVLDRFTADNMVEGNVKVYKRVLQT